MELARFLLGIGFGVAALHFHFQNKDEGAILIIYLLVLIFWHVGRL